MSTTTPTNRRDTAIIKRAIYPGTFDPITKGHVDLIERSLTVFDELTVLVAHSTKKTPLFDAQTRRQLIEECFSGNRSIRVELHDGLLADYAKQHSINVILRGLRVLSDFEYELQMATMNHRMNNELQTFFLTASENYIFVNSTLVKEIFAHGGDIQDLVPANVLSRMKENTR